MGRVRSVSSSGTPDHGDQVSPVDSVAQLSQIRKDATIPTLTTGGDDQNSDAAAARINHPNQSNNSKVSVVLDESESQGPTTKTDAFESRRLHLIQSCMYFFF